MRLWDSGVDWNLVETSRGVYDWSTLDNWINLAVAGGYKVEYTFGTTPAWAAAATNLPPSNMKYWDEFVTAVATRYKGKIEAYELWNEANVPDFYGGSVADLVTMQQHAYMIIKSIDHSALVLSPSCQGASWGYLDKFLTAGAKGYMDAVAVHLYNKSPEVDGAALVAGYRSVMKAHGMANTPMWNTEFGWGLNTEMPDANEQVAFLARSYLLLWGMGVPRNYWYAYDDSDSGTLRLPNTGNPGTITPAGVAYQTVYSWMVGRTMTPCSNTGTVWSCQFTDAAGAASLALWNTAGTSEYRTGIYNRYEDLTGAIHSVSHGKVSIGKNPILLFTTPVQPPPSR